MAYQIKLEVFEGPFDLLLNLISRQKIDIYDIPIAKITREYLGFIDKMSELDLEISTEFIVTAATLLDIKAANLLPKKEESVDEDEDVAPHEARELLIARLIEYKKFKNVSMELAARYEAESKYYARDVGLEEQFSNLMPDFLFGVALSQLQELFISINEKKVISLMQAEHITPKPLSVDEYVEKVKTRLTSQEMKSFRDLTIDCSSKVEIITMFLAVLELYKRGAIELGQAETFGEITINRVGIPFGKLGSKT